MTLTVAFVYSLMWGTSTLAQQPAPLPPLDAHTFDSYLGTCQLPSGRLIVIARTERRLYAYEPGSERLGGLDRVDDLTWIAGPTLLVYKPEIYRLSSDSWAWVELNYRPHAYQATSCEHELGSEVPTRLPLTNILLSMSRI